MSIDKNVKKYIEEEWKKAFPDLTKYEQNRFYKVLGPVIVGIDLIKLPGIDKYRPHFVIYGLWPNRMGKDLKACLSGPIVLSQYFDKNKRQLDLPYSMETGVLEEGLRVISEQTAILFQQHSVRLEDLFNILNEYLSTSSLKGAPNSFLAADIHKTKLFLALYINQSEAEKVLKGIVEWPWDEKGFKMVGVDVSQWLNELRDRIADREGFMRIIAENRADKKLEKLKFVDLVL